MYYDLIKIIHVLGAAGTTGSMLIAPWMSYKLKTTESINKRLLLKGLEFTDLCYNIAGWILILSGIVMFWLQDWHRIFQIWFILSAAIFTIDSLAEKKWRDPALEVLENIEPNDSQWLKEVKRLHKAVIIQMFCTFLIFIVMLLHSQFNLNILDIALFF